MSKLESDSGLNRRGIILAAATGAALFPVVSKAAPAASSTAKRVAPPLAGSKYALMTATQEKIATQFAGSRWEAAKQTLIQSNSYPFLAPFTETLTVDRIIFDEVTTAAAVTPPYDPFQTEALAASVSQLLDRCLSNRRQMYDIEEQAIRRALEYQLFKDQYLPQLNIELAEASEKQRVVEKAGQDAAKTKFHNADDNLGEGFSAVSAATSNSLGLAITAEQDRKTNVRAKWNAAQNYQLALQDRHTTPGCSLNYVERFGRLEMLLRQDINMAFQKLRCLQVGLNKIFGLSLNLPPIQLNGYLDALVMFSREAIEQAGIATIEEIDFDHIVSLRQQKAVKADGTGPVQRISDAMWNSAMGPSGTGYINFKLDDEFGPAIKRLRLRSVGASVLFSDNSGDTMGSPPNITQHQRSTKVVIFPPDAPDLFAPGAWLTRSPQIIGAMTWFDAQQTKMSALGGMNNLDPRDRQWGIQLSNNILYADGGLHGRGSSVTEVRLHLRLSAIVDQNLAPPWSNFA